MANCMKLAAFRDITSCQLVTFHHIPHKCHKPKELNFIDTIVTPPKPRSVFYCFHISFGELLRANIAVAGKVYVILGDKLG
jgi:hypothetical protein